MLIYLLAAGLFEALRNADAHVANVAWRLQTANASVCRDLSPTSGLVLQTLDQYVLPERAEAARFGLNDVPQINAVASGSMAERAGLKPGDDVVAINGVPTARRSTSNTQNRAFSEVEDQLQSALESPPARLTLPNREVRLEAVAGCRGTVRLIPGARIDASAGATDIEISGAMFEFLRSDDELAFVIAHELAHIALGHSAMLDRAGASWGPFAGLGANGRNARARESEADKLAVRMMVHAGYDPDAIVPFLLRSKKRLGLSLLDGTHPQWKRRISIIEAEIAEVRAAKTSPDSKNPADLHMPVGGR